MNPFMLAIAVFYFLAAIWEFARGGWMMAVVYAAWAVSNYFIMAVAGK